MDCIFGLAYETDAAFCEKVFVILGLVKIDSPESAFSISFNSSTLVLDLGFKLPVRFFSADDFKGRISLLLTLTSVLVV